MLAAGSSLLLREVSRLRHTRLTSAVGLRRERGRDCTHGAQPTDAQRCAPWLHRLHQESSGCSSRSCVDGGRSDPWCFTTNLRELAGLGVESVVDFLRAVTGVPWYPARVVRSSWSPRSGFGANPLDHGDVASSEDQDDERLLQVGFAAINGGLSGSPRPARTSAQPRGARADDISGAAIRAGCQAHG
jgi:hypothetical protein